VRPSKPASRPGTNRPSSRCSTPQAACRQRPEHGSGATAPGSGSYLPGSLGIRRDSRAPGTQASARMLASRRRNVLGCFIHGKDGVGGSGHAAVARRYSLTTVRSDDVAEQRKDPVRKAPGLGQASDGRWRRRHELRQEQSPPGGRKHWSVEPDASASARRGFRA
jgi:hypothetical protein